MDYNEQEFEKMLDPEQCKEEVNVCCCSPELTHNEAMKLKLMYKDDKAKYGEKKIFERLPRGVVNQLNPFFFSGTTFKGCNTIGQN